MVKHLAFKARLRSFLYGNHNSEGPLRDPQQCALGQWITERRQGLYRAVAEMEALDREHRHIHAQANHLMDTFRAGRQAEAQAGFADVQRTADSITGLLQRIEKQLHAAGVTS